MPFEPFAAECPTCGSRLRVSSEALLGTISACPKCGSMVKIEAPLQDGTRQDADKVDLPHPPLNRPQVKLGTVPVDSEAITEDGIASELANDSEASAGELKSGFSSAPPIHDSNQSDPHLADRATLAGPPPTWQDSENWQSAKTRRTRHIVMIATIALSTLSVTVLTFGWFLRSQKPNTGSVAQNSETAIVPAESASTEVADPDSDAIENPIATDEATDPKPAFDVVETENATPQNVLAELTDKTPTMAEASDLPQTIIPQTIIPQSIIPQSIIPQSLIPTSPIGSSGDTSDDTTGQELPSMKELPAGLQQYIPQLLQEGPAEETSLDAPPTINQIEIDAATEEDSNTLGIEPPKPINLKRDLGFKVAFNSKGYPLPSLLLLISEMTGVPIQIDWTSFDLAGLEVAKPIKVVGKARTARVWLDTIAKQVDAEIREKQFVIVMTINDQAFAKAETELLDLADFGPQSKSAALVIEQFMGANIEVAQMELKEGGEADSEEEEEPAKPDAPIDVMEARERAQLKILATEMLRRMRAVKPRLPDDRASRWMQVLGERFADWKPISDVDPTELKQGPQTDTPITTAAMLRQISSINESVCLVNWYDANRRGMRPTRLVMPYTDKTSVAKTLSSVLDPLSMQVRRVDTNHWWVGSGATYDRLPVLVHSDRLGVQREDFVAQVDRIMSANPDAVYQSAFDPVSDRMLMLLPRYVARQLFKVSQEIAKVP